MSLNGFQIWNFLLFIAAASIIGNFVSMIFKRYGKLHFASRSMMFFWLTILFYSATMMVLVINQLTDYGHHNGSILGTVLRTLAIVSLGLGVREYKRGE